MFGECYITMFFFGKNPKQKQLKTRPKAVTPKPQKVIAMASFLYIVNRCNWVSWF